MVKILILTQQFSQFLNKTGQVELTLTPSALTLGHVVFHPRPGLTHAEAAERRRLKVPSTEAPTRRGHLPS